MKRRRIEVVMRRMADVRKIARRSFIVEREHGKVEDRNESKRN
jgi:hypothetical protein